MRGGAGPGGGAGGLEQFAGASGQRLERDGVEAGHGTRGLGSASLPGRRVLAPQERAAWAPGQLLALPAQVPCPAVSLQVPAPQIISHPPRPGLCLLSPAAHVVSSRSLCPRPCPLNTCSPRRAPSAPTPHIVSSRSPRVLEDTAWRAAGTARMGVCCAGDPPLLDARALGRLFPVGTHARKLGCWVAPRRALCSAGRSSFTSKPVSGLRPVGAPRVGGRRRTQVGGRGCRQRPPGNSVGNRCVGPGRTASPMCLQEGCAVSPHGDRGPERWGRVCVGGGSRPGSQSSGLQSGGRHCSRGFGCKVGSGPRDHHDSRRGGHRAGAAWVYGGRRWPGDPPGRTGSQQVVRGAPSELCGLLTLAGVGRVGSQNRQVRDTSAGVGG